MGDGGHFGSDQRLLLVGLGEPHREVEGLNLCQQGKHPTNCPGPILQFLILNTHNHLYDLIGKCLQPLACKIKLFSSHNYYKNSIINLYYQSLNVSQLKRHPKTCSIFVNFIHHCWIYSTNYSDHTTFSRVFASMNTLHIADINQHSLQNKKR